MNRSLVLSATVIVVAVLAVSCGDDDGGDEVLPPIRTTTTITTTSTTVNTSRIFYEIKPGETLSQIAESFGVPYQAIVELNGITDPDDIPAGETIEIPTGVVLVTALPTTSTPTPTT
jgi:LysM repeat protein